ncbi:MAG: CHAT domain-containing tetratricopeptide repeat protein [Thermoanaerobaculia bacterium]
MLLLFPALLGSPSATRGAGAPPSRPFELAAGARLSLTLDLEPGEPWLLVAEQQGLDLSLRVSDAAGRTLAEVDGPWDRDGFESWLFEPTEAGPITVELNAREPGAPRGRGVFTVATLPRRSERDRRRLAAERALSRAGERYFEGSRAAREQALLHFLEARQAFRELGELRQEARALYAAAVLARLTDQPAKALDLAEGARELWQGAGEGLWTAASWNEVGLDLWLGGKPGPAASAFEEARQLADHLPHPFTAAVAASNLCLVELGRGRLRSGLDCYEEAVLRLEAVAARALEAGALTSSGRAWDVLGEPQRALDTYRRALDAATAAGYRDARARLLNNLALLEGELGEQGKALAHYGEALALLRESQDSRWQARVLNNLGQLYDQLGELGQARSCLDQALPLWRSVGDASGAAFTLSNLGLLSARQGLYHEALELHRQALDLRRAAGDRRGQALSLTSLGAAQVVLDQTDEALPNLSEAVRLATELGDAASLAEALVARSRAELARAEPARARQSLGSALEIQQRLGYRPAELLTLTELAEVERSLGRPAEARARAEAAIALVESLHQRVPGADLKASFSSSTHKAYELALELAMAEREKDPSAPRRGLELAERARARTLLELLSDAGVELAPAGDPALLARRRELETRLAAKLSRLGRLGAEDPARPLLEQSERELVAELDPLEAALAESARGANNAPQSLAPARALSAPEAQALLDPETAVLFYALGADESFLWWLTPTRLEAFPLGPRQAFEPLARELAEQLARLDPGDRAAQSELARALAERLLAPLGTRLRTARHLAIVADGALGYLPFAVLPEPGDGTLLSARHELSYLPSLSALAAARSRPRSGELAQGTIAVVADPVLRADDPRLPSAARRSAGSVADPSPLPASRLEAEAILSLARKGQARALLGFDAARSRVIGGELAGQRILHFATHGVIDAAEPARSGLLLSAWNAAGEPQESFLGLRDVYGLKLGAELVVLSGCRTALGRELRGEGLVGLARGFLYAGTPRVIASLWPVEDQATAALMAHFYRALWQDGLPPAAALARAQSALAADRRWRDPFFWAGFVLEGEWR